MAEKDDRATRLAQKLRENLRKRKAQARASGDEPDPTPRGGALPDGGSD